MILVIALNLIALVHLFSHFDLIILIILTLNPRSVFPNKM